MKDRRSSRNGTRISWIALHTSEGGGTAAQLRDADWWEGSSHAVSDNTTLIDERTGCVDPAWGAWTLRSGNPRSVNIEQIGYASRTRDEWLTKYKGTLENTAQWVARMAKRFDVPLVYIGTQGVKDGKAGVIHHNDYSKGTGDGTHWDPGPGYPTDWVIDRAREINAGVPAAPTPSIPSIPEDDDMPLSNEDVDRIVKGVAAIKVGVHGAPKGTLEPLTDSLFRLSRLEGTAGAIRGLILTGNAGVAALHNDDPAAIAAAVWAAMPPGEPVSQATVEAGVRAVLGTLDTP